MEEEKKEEFSAPINTQSKNGPYAEPIWGSKSDFPFKLEVIKGGIIIDTLDLSEKSSYSFGKSTVFIFPKNKLIDISKIIKQPFKFNKIIIKQPFNV